MKLIFFVCLAMLFSNLSARADERLMSADESLKSRLDEVDEDLKKTRYRMKACESAEWMPVYQESSEPKGVFAGKEKVWRITLDGKCDYYDDTVVHLLKKLWADNYKTVLGKVCVCTKWVDVDVPTYDGFLEKYLTGFKHLREDLVKEIKAELRAEIMADVLRELITINKINIKE